MLYNSKDLLFKTSKRHSQVKTTQSFGAKKINLILACIRTEL